MQQFEQMLGNPQQQQEFPDFANRFQQGPVTEGYSDQEAVQRFQQVAPQLPPQEFQQSATQAFQQFTPQQRQEFGQFLASQAQQQNVNVPLPQQPSAYQDPGTLAQAVTQVHQQQPGLLAQLLGAGSGGGQSSTGGGSSMLSNPLAKAALAGIAAMAAQRMFGNR